MPVKESTVAKDFLAQEGGALDGRINQIKLASKNCYELFRAPVTNAANGNGGAASGTTGATNRLLTRRNELETHIKGAGQTIAGPVRTNVGLDIGMDQANDEGVEITGGYIASADEREWNVFKVGTDEPFYCKLTAKIEDVSGSDDFCFGFRKVEAYQANVDDYDEGAWLQMRSGDIYTETILNNAATSSTDTTRDWADGETHTFEVRVGHPDGKVGPRVVTFWVDGVRVNPSVSYSFDLAEYVMPFLFFLHAVDLAGKVEITKLEWGYQKDKGVID